MAASSAAMTIENAMPFRSKNWKRKIFRADFRVCSIGDDAVDGGIEALDKSIVSLAERDGDARPEIGGICQFGSRNLAATSFRRLKPVVDRELVVKHIFHTARG